MFLFFRYVLLVLTFPVVLLFLHLWDMFALVTPVVGKWLLVVGQANQPFLTTPHLVLIFPDAWVTHVFFIYFVVMFSGVGLLTWIYK